METSSFYLKRKIGNSVLQPLDFCSWNSLNHHDLASLVMTRSADYRFRIPWVLNKIWRYLGGVCRVISPSSYCISLELERLLSYKNINSKKGVPSLFVVIQAVVCLPKLWGASPLLSVALWPPLAVAGPWKPLPTLPGNPGSAHLGWELCCHTSPAV